MQPPGRMDLVSDLVVSYCLRGERFRTDRNPHTVISICLAPKNHQWAKWYDKAQKDKPFLMLNLKSSNEPNDKGGKLV